MRSCVGNSRHLRNSSAFISSRVENLRIALSMRLFVARDLESGQQRNDLQIDVGNFAPADVDAGGLADKALVQRRQQFHRSIPAVEGKGIVVSRADTGDLEM